MKAIIKRNCGLIISLSIVLLLLLVRTNSYKYGPDTNTLFIIFHNIIFEHNTINTVAGINHFSAHFSPFLILIAPLYFLGPTMMIFVWKFCCYGLFLIIMWHLINNEERYKVSNLHKNIFLLLVLLHPTFVANLISSDIWDSDLILPFLGLSILFISENKYFWGIFWLCITFLIKEDMYLVGILYGIAIVLRTKKYSFIWLSILSLLLFWITTHFIMPYYAVSNSGLFLLKASYGDMGNSLGEIVINIIRDPSLILSSGLWLRKIASILIIFLCVCFLPFWKNTSLIYLIPGLATLGYTLIAMQPYLDYSKHYMLAFYVFVVWSSYNSYSLINVKYRTRAALLSIIASIVVILVLQINIRNGSWYMYPIENRDTIDSVVEKLIPPNGYMLTSGEGSPWTCYNKNCYVSPDFSPDEIESRKYNYILINLKTIFWEIISCNDKSMTNNLRKLNSNNKYQILYYGNDIILLKRRNNFFLNSVQLNWSENLESYEKINNDCMKSKLMRTLRLL